MEGVREQFRRTGHDHPRCTFNNGGDFANVLKGIFKEPCVVVPCLISCSMATGRGPHAVAMIFASPDFPVRFPLPGGNSNNAPGGAWRNPSSRGGRAPAMPMRSPCVPMRYGGSARHCRPAYQSSSQG